MSNDKKQLKKGEEFRHVVPSKTLEQANIDFFFPGNQKVRSFCEEEVRKAMIEKGKLDKSLPLNHKWHSLETQVHPDGVLVVIKAME